MPVKEKVCYYTIRKGYYKKGGSNKRRNNFGKSKCKLRANLMDSDGNIMRCHECNLTKHFPPNCPYGEVEKTNMTVYITFVTRRADSGTGSVLVESLGKGTLDSTCTKTISGEEWINEYIDNINEEDKEGFCSKTDCNSLFIFDDGLESKSIKTINIPIVIGSKCSRCC